MRETFSYDDEKEIIQKNLKDKKAEIELLKKGTENINGNVASILSALNISLNSNLAKKWIQVSTQFARYVHRDSKNKKPIEPIECEELWGNYED